MASTTGTARDVVAAFVDGRPLRTASAPVPGGARVRSVVQPDGTVELLSYRTAVAVRQPDGSVAVSTQRYTVTTSKLMGRVRVALARAGYAPGTAEATIHAAVPGRWGGFGPAWHATGWEDVPATVWTAAE